MDDMTEDRAIAQAIAEYREDGVIAADTYITLTNLGVNADALIESLERGDA